MEFKVTVEVPMFLAFFGFFLTESVNTNLIIYRTCYVLMGLDQYNCSLLGNSDSEETRTLEKLVQPKADLVGMVKSSIDSVAAALLCLFVGAWSDRFGRKPVIVVSLTGYTVMMLVMVIFSVIETASPWYMIVCSIPVIAAGGGASLLTVLLAYLTDVTNEQHRGYRMGLFEGVMGAAVFIGSWSSSYLLNATSYPIVYFIGAVSCFSGLLYTIYLIPESLVNRETENRIKGFFDRRNVSGLFKTTFRTRSHYNRAVILLVIFALALYFVVIAGDGSVMFLFMRAKFHWTLHLYTTYTSISTATWIIGATLLLYIVHFKLKVKETILIFAGFVSSVVGMIMQGVAQADWLIYAAIVVKIPSTTISAMTKSLISKSVEADEVAKIFSVFTMLQNLLGLVGSPVYTLLYNATINTNPGIFNFVTAGGHAVNSLCLLAALILQRKTVPEDYSRLQEEPRENGENTRIVSADGSSYGATAEKGLLVIC